jgi:hypothetical protein
MFNENNRLGKAMNAGPESLYLDLMKKTLSFTLWKEPGIPIEKLYYAQPPIKRGISLLLTRLFRIWDLQIIKSLHYSDRERNEGLIWPQYADTMIGIKRLDNIQFCVEKVIRNQISGDLIEAGVWRGGASIFIRAILAAYQVSDRRVFVADSFEGLPKPDEAKYPQDAGDKHYTQRFLAVSKDEVKANFDKYGLLDERVVFLPGWFKDTLPNAPIDKIAVMRVDGDMYGSTMEALISLYPKLSEGGFCIIDDYALAGCKRAVDDFRAQWNIATPLERIDWTGVFWQKG